MDLILQPANAYRLGDFLKENLAKKWDVFRAAVAFVKRSGTRHIVKELSNFRGDVDLIAGIDHQGTSKEGLEDLLKATQPKGRLTIFHNPISSTFHPKIYCFGGDKTAVAYIGSGNLTEGGLYTNYEASVCFKLDFNDPSHSETWKLLNTTLDQWSDDTSGNAHKLDIQLLNDLVARGYVPTEVLSRKESNGERSSGTAKDEKSLPPIFFPKSVQQAPRTIRAKTETKAAISSSKVQPRVFAGNPGFVMTLQTTDVGRGEKTKGAKRRSPEIFVPLAAIRMNEDFWGYPKLFSEDSQKARKFDRPHVSMRLGTEVISVSMMTWPDKADFRLRSEAIRSAGHVGDIMRIEKVPSGQGYEYYIEIIPPNTNQFKIYDDLCVHSPRSKNSKKRFGYY
jgi:HKD family nuclease